LGGSRDPCIRWGADASTGRSTFEVSGRLKSIVKNMILGSSKRVNCANMGGPILTIYMSYDVFPQKNVPFEVSLLVLPI